MLSRVRWFQSGDRVVRNGNAFGRLGRVLLRHARLTCIQSYARYAQIIVVPSGVYGRYWSCLSLSLLRCREASRLSLGLSR
ncbi:hypothetical protein O9992_11130 [Vibrio lentus]|nr:hypothetical protein [Vibrio lentus]